MIQDVSYFESGYIDATYYTTRWDGQSNLSMSSNLHVHIPDGVIVRANPTSNSSMVATGGLRIPAQIYTIFTPVTRTVFSGLTNGVTA